MKLEPNFVIDVSRILDGRITDPAEAAILAKCLDSVEEFFAWNLLRQDTLAVDPEIGDCVKKLAITNITNAETSREKHGFELEKRRALEELRVALGEIIKADEDTHQEHNKAYRAMVRLAGAKDSGDDLLRFELDINI